LGRAQAGKSVLLIAPTGAGKTLAGFMPTLTDLAVRPKRKPGEARRGIHTLYISPLKALAVDIERNLTKPVEEMGLPLTLETRTGDTPAHKRQRQKLAPPDILLTTPEQLALLIATSDAGRFFEDLRYVVFDELHSLVTSKRGHLLALGLARLRAIVPGLQAVGLSATVADPDELRRWLVGQGTPFEVSAHDTPTPAPPLKGEGEASADAKSPSRLRGGARDGGAASRNEPPMAELITVAGGAKPDVSVLDSRERVPWQGHSSRYAIPEIYELVKQHKTSLLFVNTRSQAELLFAELWRINEDSLPIALHHGSLDVSQRRRVEKAMETNSLRAIVATSTLDLGIDWGDVDLVIHVGAPKGASRLAQRIGRSNHRMDEPSKAVLVPSNRFEVLECRAALEASTAARRTRRRSARAHSTCWRSMCWGWPAARLRCRRAFSRGADRRTLRGSRPPQLRPRRRFRRHRRLRAEKLRPLRRIRKTEDGLWRVSHPRVAQQYRLNVGTIIEAPLLNVRYVRQGKGAVGARRAGARQDRGGLSRNAGRMATRFCSPEKCCASRASARANVMSQRAGKRRRRCRLLRRRQVSAVDLPRRPGSRHAGRSVALEGAARTGGGLAAMLQAEFSVLPSRGDLLVETFPYGDRFYMVAYPSRAGWRTRRSACC
jgi:ATP-dependent Lhr-like helicase